MIRSLGDVIGGIRDGNRLPTVPKFQFAATATYEQRFSDNADWYVNGSFQHVGNRFTQPGDQEPAPASIDLHRSSIRSRASRRCRDTDIGSLQAAGLYSGQPLGRA